MHHGEGQNQPRPTGYDPLYGEKVSIQLNRSCAKWSNNCKIEVRLRRINHFVLFS